MNKKIFISETLLFGTFFNLTAALTISSYSTGSIYYKILSSLLFFGAIYHNSRLKKIPLKNLLKENFYKKIILFLVMLTTLFSITLFYSLSPEFGALKLAAFVSAAIPSILLFPYLFLTGDETRIKIFLILSALLIIITAILSIILNPYDHSTMYSFGINRWSHVAVGRITGLLLLFIFVFLEGGEARREKREERSEKREVRSEKREERREKPVFRILLYSALFLGIVNLIFISNRTVTLSLALIFIIFLIKRASSGSSYPPRRDPAKGVTSTWRGWIIYFIIFSGFTAGYLLLNFYEARGARFENVLTLEFDKEDPLRSRIYMVDKSLEIIKERPLLGVGFGGFTAYQNDPALKDLKYAHNIFLELFTELGLIIGGILSIALLYYLFYGFKVNFYAGAFILFVLLLALTSKDIASQMWFLFTIALIRGKG
jgi:O-antigen ligase